jgi:uncharacterized protein YndB with AHSA1/START domain
VSKTAGQDGDEQRVEELLRVNASLAAELRGLRLGRTDAPRSAAMPTSRRLAVLLDERETLTAQLEETRAHLEVTRAHRDEIERRNAELGAEVARLRSGWQGVLRRLRARLLRS